MDQVDQPAIDRAEARDLSAIRALLERCGLPVEDLGPTSLGHFVLCRAGGAPVGTVGLDPLGDHGLLRSLAVVPDARGRGLGRLLLDRVLGDARGLGLRRLYLLTTSAAAFFARSGFAPVARAHAPRAIQETAEYSALCPTTAVLMAVDL